MTVYKYKSFEEAEKALWNFNPDQRYFDRIKQFWNFASKLSPAKPFKKGIVKFHSITEKKNPD